MFCYEQTEREGKLTVFGWDDWSGEDAVVIGCLVKCEEGYWWFEAETGIKLSCKMLGVLMNELSALNTSPP